MRKVNVLQRLKKSGVVAVIRGETKEEAIKASHAVVAGGIKGIELTFTVPKADQVINELVLEYKEDASVVVGAGTVLDPVTARIAIMAGAEYVVSPCFNKETAEMCNLYQVPYLPGCMTITEMQEALKAGVDIIKVFPGNMFGSQAISAFKAPMPYVNIMPTGGVNLSNLEEWFKAGAICVGVGGNLLAGVKTGNFPEVTRTATQYMIKYQQIKGV